MGMLELLNNNYVRIIGSTLAVYVFIVVAIRLFGKKELAQLSVVNLVFILLISRRRDFGCSAGTWGRQY
jgi:hypothetical protein